MSDSSCFPSLTVVQGPVKSGIFTARTAQLSNTGWAKIACASNIGIVTHAWNPYIASQLSLCLYSHRSQLWHARREICHQGFHPIEKYNRVFVEITCEATLNNHHRSRLYQKVTDLFDSEKERSTMRDGIQSHRQKIETSSQRRRCNQLDT